MGEFRRQSVHREPPGKPPAMDYEHRTTVNLLAVIAIMLLTAGLYWTVTLIGERSRIERCVGVGRRDCFVVPDPSGILPPARR